MEPIRIGCAGAFWGDSIAGVEQLVSGGQIDYLVFDYLAEITMSLLARARARKPELGHVPDFVAAIAPLLADIRRKNIRVVSNAGGLNPHAAAAALRREADLAGVSLNIAVVTGDDLSDRVPDIRAGGTVEMFSGAPMPEKLMTVNAYLGAQPIAAALDRGADVVITGRCVDSAVVLGPLVHAFGWSWTDYDRLAQGSLAGHLLECAAQVTGGLFTDWRDVPGWDDMGMPIAQCAADGTFEIRKPDRTGGLVSPLSVAEQMLYEIGDPAAYMLPDVICDFSRVALSSVGPDRVRVAGARGRMPTPSLKVSATWHDGYRVIGTVTVGGHDAAAKAERVGEAILRRVRRLLAARNFPDFAETSVEVLGTESIYGPQRRNDAKLSREVVLKIAARHQDDKALEILAREIAPAASSMAQGLTGFFAGRPGVQPVVRLFSFVWPKTDVAPLVHVGGETFAVPFRASAAATALPADSAPAAPHARFTSPWRGEVDRASARSGGGDSRAASSVPMALPHPDHRREATAVDPPPPGDGEAECAARACDHPDTTVPLIALAVGRSGDKGNSANIGIIARRPEFLPWVRAALTSEAVHAFFAHTGVTTVERFEVPGIHALNFVLHDALGGGGVASLRIDPQGKAFAQMLMDVPVPVPQAIAEAAGACSVTS
jgi:acyclic terpene utilization AtuA family protein